MPYSPPAWNAVNIELRPSSNPAYTAPAYNVVNIELAPSFPQTLSGITAGSQVLFGTTTLQAINTILPAGLDAALVGTPKLIWDQFVRPSGATYDQYGTPLLIQDQFLRNVTAGMLTFFGGQNVYNFDQYLTGVSAGDTKAIGSDALHTDPVLYPQWFIATQYGTAFVSTDPQYLKPGGWLADQYGTATVYNLDQFIDVDSHGIDSAKFGALLVARDPQVLSAIGFDALQFPAAAAVHVSTDPQYIKPAGYLATLYGTSFISNWTRYVTPAGLAVGNFGTLWISLYIRYLQPVGFDSAIAWDDYGPVSIVAQGGGQVYVRDALVLPSAGAQTQFGTATVSN